MDKILCFDFDDTLFNRLTEEPIQGAVEALNQFKAKGYKILIFSSRMNPELWGGLVEFRKQEIRDWMEKYKMPYDKVVSFKAPADLYIDDKGYRFAGNWKEAVKEIMKLI